MVSYLLEVIFVFIILSTLYLVLTITVKAAAACSDDLYYVDTVANSCIHKSGGYSDPTNPTADVDGCIYAFEKADDNSCPGFTHTPDQTPTPPTGQNQPAPSSTLPPPDENALNNLNKGLLPPQVTQSVQPSKNDQNFLQRFASNLADLFQQVLGFKPTDKNHFPPKADVESQSQTPPEVQPSTAPNPVVKSGEDLGNQTGIYSVSIPSAVNQGNKDTQDFEKKYEQSNFPSIIHPITGQ